MRRPLRGIARAERGRSKLASFGIESKSLVAAPSVYINDVILDAFRGAAEQRGLAADSKAESMMSPI